jgi:hypothetical protein
MRAMTNDQGRSGFAESQVGGTRSRPFGRRCDTLLTGRFVLGNLCKGVLVPGYLAPLVPDWRIVASVFSCVNMGLFVGLYEIPFKRVLLHKQDCKTTL